MSSALQTPQWLSAQEAAEYLGAPKTFKPTWFAKKVREGEGPVCTYFGRKPFFLAPDLDAWRITLQKKPRK